jgi:hypothetical protein
VDRVRGLSILVKQNSAITIWYRTGRRGVFRSLPPQVACRPKGRVRVLFTEVPSRLLPRHLASGIKGFSETGLPTYGPRKLRASVNLQSCPRSLTVGLTSLAVDLRSLVAGLRSLVAVPLGRCWREPVAGLVWRPKVPVVVQVAVKE